MVERILELRVLDDDIRGKTLLAPGMVVDVLMRGDGAAWVDLQTLGETEREAARIGRRGVVRLVV